jgi:nucleotidyltransferase/DNA polymerase involved in DNA repair
MQKNKKIISKALKEIPGVGDKLSRALMDLGYRRVNDLKGENPEEMYHSLGALRQRHIDRCVLYVFRCAVYYAESATPDAKLLKWWNWKDTKQDSATNRKQ